MTVSVLTAVTGAPWESDLVAALAHAPFGVRVVRRCVDLADLLAVAASGAARAVFVSAELRRLDLDAVSRLRACGVAVVGLVTPGDDEGERRLRQLGIDPVLNADAGAQRISAAVLDAVQTLARDQLRSPRHGYSEPLSVPPSGPLSGPLSELPDPAEPDDTEFAEPPVEPGSGRLVAVWGPTGAPGRTTVAVNLAAELAVAGTSTLLADADSYGGAVAHVLGLLDEAPGLAAAARLANTSTLDVPALARLARRVDGADLRVLTGIARADRWPELRPSSLDVVWRLARSLALFTVVDCGFCLEQDEEIAFDTAAPRRNGATLTTLQAADTVVAVGAADPVGVQRLVRGLAELAEVIPGVTPLVLLTRVRRGPVGPDPQRQLAAALHRFAAVDRVIFMADDRVACDRALAAGRALREVAPGSPARRVLADLAAELVRELVGGDAAPRRRRGIRRRR